MTRSTSIRQALQHVQDHPEITTDDALQLKVHELIARTLFQIANNPGKSDQKSMHRANVAREMIFKRMIGRRRPGTHPARARDTGLEFRDLTVPEVEK